MFLDKKNKKNMKRNLNFFNRNKTLIIVFVLMLAPIPKNENGVEYLDIKCNPITKEVIVEASYKGEEIEYLSTEEFISYIGFLESRNNWKIVNSYNYIGEYQFGKSAMKAIGYSTRHIDFIRKNFKKEPDIFSKERQDYAVNLWFELLEKRLDTEFELFENKTINGLILSKPALLAAAHLGGVGSVKKYLYSNGKQIKKDGYNTSIETYIKRFQNFRFCESESFYNKYKEYDVNDLYPPRSKYDLF
jgi:hypothetical protein